MRMTIRKMGEIQIKADNVGAARIRCRTTQCARTSDVGRQ